MKYTFDERVEDDLYCAAGLDLLRSLVEDPEAAGAELPGAVSGHVVKAA